MLFCISFNLMLVKYIHVTPHSHSLFILMLCIFHCVNIAHLICMSHIYVRLTFFFFFFTFLVNLVVLKLTFFYITLVEHIIIYICSGCIPRHECSAFENATKKLYKVVLTICSLVFKLQKHFCIICLFHFRHFQNVCDISFLKFHLSHNSYC